MRRRTRILVSDKAQDDIAAQIAYYRIEASDSTAQKWKQGFEASVALLRDFPEIGAIVIRTDKGNSIRRTFVKDFRDHLIFYEFFADSNLVQVLSVKHGARDLQGLFSED